MTTQLDEIARAICAETCAFKGEPPCHSFRDEAWPNPYCDEPGCQTLASVALYAIAETVTNTVAFGDWSAASATLASQILMYLGIGSEPSMEPGADRRRDRIAAMIEASKEENK